MWRKMNLKSNDKMLTNRLKENFNVYDLGSPIENKVPSDKKENMISTNQIQDYLVMAENVHDILLNCSNLTRKQKLDYCNSQRYLMKLYLKHFIYKFRT